CADTANKRRTPLAAIVAERRRLNLYYFGAHIGQQHRAHRAGENAGEVNNEQVVQWFHAVEPTKRAAASESLSAVQDERDRALIRQLHIHRCLKYTCGYRNS